MVLKMSKGPTGGEISDISEALLDHLVKIAYPAVGMLLEHISLQSRFLVCLERRCHHGRRG